MTQDKLSALLGRPLSSVETTNFNTYYSIAQSQVNDLLCSNICSEVGVKRFDARQGYKTLTVPILTEIDYIKIGDTLTTKYEVRQGSNLNGEWYNSIVFDAPLYCDTVEIKADWGFAQLPVDVQILIAQLFGMIGDSLDSELVQSKRVEDFSITLKSKTKTEVFASKYSATIAKYSGCVNGNVQHGNVRHIL